MKSTQPLFIASTLLIIFGGIPSRAVAGPSEADREAILAMAGKYSVLFNFEEVVALQPGYKLKPAYQEEATEIVVVVEESPERIVLQHLLQTNGGKRVVKHWKQVWTYEDTRIVEFLGNDRWALRDLEPESVKGGWTQLVTQVDDSPRYEGLGRWVHESGFSRWESGPTNRPLPRREHTKRDDYQILKGINRHAITPAGWVHEQDNLKLVTGDDSRYLAREAGLNYYDRTDETDFSPALDYWKETAAFWGRVSAVWEDIMANEAGFAFVANDKNVPMWDFLFDRVKALRAGEESLPESEQIRLWIADFVKLEQNVALTE